MQKMGKFFFPVFRVMIVLVLLLEHRDDSRTKRRTGRI